MGREVLDLPGGGFAGGEVQCSRYLEKTVGDGVDDTESEEMTGWGRRNIVGNVGQDEVKLEWAGVG